MKKLIYVFLCVLIVLNIFLYYYVIVLNKQIENNPNQIQLRDLENKYLLEKDIGCHIFLESFDLKELPELEALKQSKYFALRISSAYCRSCVNDEVVDFIKFCAQNNLKSNSVIFAYFSEEREKIYFKNKYENKINIIFLKYDDLFSEQDKYMLPYYFMLNDTYAANCFYTASGGFRHLRNRYYEIIMRHLIKQSFK